MSIKNKNISILLAILIFFIPSCSLRQDEDKVLKELEKFNAVISASEEDASESMPHWLEAESEYKYNTDSDGVDNIIGLFNSGYLVQNDRMYFNLYNENGNMVWMYVSIETGEIHSLCPDPICEHTKNSGCRYVGFDSLHPDEENSSVLYASKTQSTNIGFESAICRIDLEDDSVTELYKTDLMEYGMTQNFYNICFVRENKLYFTDTQIGKAKNDSGEVERIEKTYFHYLDTVSGALTTLSYDYDANQYCLFAKDGRVYFSDILNSTLYTTDTEFKNRENILTYDENSQVYTVFYDKIESAMYFLIASKALSFSEQIAAGVEGEGRVYKLDSDNILHELEMPTETVTTFQLTNKYIYFTDFEPIRYGNTINGTATIDEFGGKIYRIARDGSGNIQTVFDGHEEIFIYGDYSILGDYLYMNYSTLERNGGFANFQLQKSILRIGLEENSVKKLQLK